MEDTKTRPLGLRLLASLLFVAALGLILTLPVQWIRVSTAGDLSTAAEAPMAPVAIVLGAGLRADGGPSPFLQSRLDTAAELYRSGKVQAILVSGDNSLADYDEPTAMQQYLLSVGIPEIVVVLDYAGFDTWDTCVRAVKVFGVTQALVITQAFHLPRAVHLCRAAGLEVAGVYAPTPQVPTLMNDLREGAAGIKAVLDGWFQPDPHFLGPHEDGIDKALAAG